MNLCPYCNFEVVNERTCRSCGMVLVGLNLALPVGTSLTGRYSVGRVLGQGGFGITYLGADKILGRAVAIKELAPEGSTRYDFKIVPPLSLRSAWRDTCSRFLDEARILANFNHPGVVHVLDVFEENSTVYLVMERLEGLTLGEEIHTVGPIPEKRVRELALKICNALRVVHQTGLLHRDLKPDNLFLTRDGRVVLIDFGSARAFNSGKTGRYTRLVTPGYAPLEQYVESIALGPYTDIYALGASIFHALTGKSPPSATDRAAGVPVEWPTTLMTVPIRNAVDTALSIRVADRPATIEQMERLLNMQTYFPILSTSKDVNEQSPAQQFDLNPLSWPVSDPAVRLQLAGATNTPAHVLADLADDPSERVRTLVAKNPKTPVNILELLLSDKKTSVAEAVGLNGNVTQDLVAMLIRSGSTLALKKLAENRNCPIQTLYLLNQKDSWFVESLARNPLCPADILESFTLFSLTDFMGRSAICKNPSVAEDKRIATLFQIAAHSNTSSNVLDHLGTLSHNDIVLRVAGNPNTSKETLEVLSKHSNPEIRRAAKEHRNWNSQN